MSEYYESIKIDPKINRTDICQPSLDLLTRQCRLFFKSRNPNACVWFADGPFVQPELALESSVIDVVFFGDFLRRFLESGLWTAQNVRLWVLCRAVKRVFVELLSFPESTISVIPRNELFPFSRRARKWPSLKSSFSMVYSGRISAAKNIEFFLLTVFYLQTEHDLNVAPVVIGDADDEFHQDLGRRIHRNFKRKIENLIESVSWKIPPKIFPKTKPEAWVQYEIEQPIFTSFSTLIFEDFGVSLAQAQELGWPAIISEWGGHRDSSPVNSIFVPCQMIGNSHESESVIGLKAKYAARYIVQKMKRATQMGIVESKKNIDAESGQSPAPLSLSQLADLRLGFIKSTSQFGQLIAREGVSAFADSPDGRKFFQKYREIFGTNISDRYITTFVNDPTELSRQVALSEEVERNCEETSVVVLTPNDLIYRGGLQTLIRSEKTFFSSDSKLPNILESMLS